MAVDKLTYTELLLILAKTCYIAMQSANMDERPKCNLHFATFACKLAK